jgi:hypothetical protein
MTPRGRKSGVPAVGVISNAQQYFRRATNSPAFDRVKQAVMPQRLMRSVGNLLQSVAFLLFRPIHTLSLIRQQEPVGLIRPKVIENLLIPAPISLMFILREITHPPTPSVNDEGTTYWTIRFARD